MELPEPHRSVARPSRGALLTSGPNVGICLVFCAVGFGQTNPQGTCKGVVAPAAEPLPKHILGVFPNHNASPCLFPYVPIGVKEKFKIASADAFDPGAIVAAALAGGSAQLFNSNRPFGQEASGYARYAGAAYANHVIGDYFREGIYPSLLHQDPRYFRRGIGSTKTRVAYALSRVFWTQVDAGGTAFNYSKVLGSATEVAISSLYYANHRGVESSSVGFAAQLGASMAANVLKEFWPDLLRRFSRKNPALTPAASFAAP
jgi:hypothetical protein